MNIYVRQGDSFWYYSRLFQIPLQLIIDSNKNIDPNKLVPGQQIRIPGFITQDYVMQTSDSVLRIAQIWQIPPETIYLVNPNQNSNQLQTGETIKLPLRVTRRLIQEKDHYDDTRMMHDLNRLLDLYPFLQVASIGKSVLQKEIPEVVVGTGEKRVHYNGSFHANEWITTSVIMTFLNDYLLALTNQDLIRGHSAYQLYQQVALSIVPMVNPDGVSLVLNGPPSCEPWKTNVLHLNQGSTDFSGWKANIRGIDLNDQFEAKWELERARNPKEPGPRDYGGEQPLSEPEVIAMAELTRKRDFTRVIAFHTQGEEIYWGFENLEPPDAETMVNEFCRVSGYKPVKVLESYAGYKDWFIQDWRRPGFTVELGLGTNPLPISQFDEIYQKSLGIFLAGLYM